MAVFLIDNYDYFFDNFFKNSIKYITIHDYQWLFPHDPNILKNNFKVNITYHTESFKKLLSQCYKIIFPSKFIFDEYAKYFSTFNFTIILHNDFKIYDNVKNSPLIINNQILF